MELLGALHTFISYGGWLAVLLTVLFLGARRWWYFAWAVDDLRAQLASVEQERQEWKSLYLDLVTQQRNLLNAVERSSRRGR